MYIAEDVIRSTEEYFLGDKLATKVWMEKYALRDPEGHYLELNPEQMHRRLAREFARIEKKYPNSLSEERIMELLGKFKYFMPGGSVMFGLGNDYSFSSLGNCFVIGNEADSYGGIFYTDQEQVQLMKRRGGVGHDISHLRPKNSLVSNSAKSSTGAVSFMPRFSNSTREVAQDGRRGALMLSIMINHPDIREFITSKDDLTKITGANISVKITDEFMYCVEHDLPYSLTFPTEPTEDEAKVEVVIRNARELWDKIVHQAWKTAEPGILFWDIIIRESPADLYDQFQSKSTNPCGEVPLSPYDSCRLGSMNLYSYVINPFTEEARFNYEQFILDAYDAQRLMDDIVDLEIEKVDKILEKVSSDKEDENIKTVEYNLWIKIRKSLVDGRRTGLGVLGLADAGAAMNMCYGSNLFVDFSESIAEQLAIASYTSSIDMAKERGCFPICEPDIEKNPFLDRIYNNLEPDTQLNWGLYGRRNIANLSIAPTGTLAILAQVTSGIEPVYAPFYRRKRKVLNDDEFTSVDATGDKWFEYNVLHPKFKEWIVLQGKKLTTNSKFIEESINAFTEEQLKEVVKTSPYANATANEIDPISKIKMQGRIQKWIDHSISITHNLPSTVTEEEVSKIYFEAWKAGCKGVTIYRDGSRDGVLTTKEVKNVVFEQHDAPKRPKELECDIYILNVKGKQFLVVVGLMEGKPYELFAVLYSGLNLTKKGFIKKVSRGVYNLYDSSRNLLLEDITSEMTQVEESTTRLISWGLRHGAGITFLTEQLSKVKGNGFQDFSRVIIRVLKKYIKDGTKPTGHTCDNCGSTELEYRDGCLTCMNCGNSKCG